MEPVGAGSGLSGTPVGTGAGVIDPELRQLAKAKKRRSAPTAESAVAARNPRDSRSL